MYKFDYSKNVLNEKKLKGSLPDSDIGEATRLVLITEDDDYLVLGTSKGYIFVLKVDDFEIKFSQKVSDEEIMDIQFKNDEGF